MPLKASFQEWQMEEETVFCTLDITYTSKYPEEAPIVEFSEDSISENLDELHVTEITELIQEQIKENLGDVMVFILVSAVQEKLQDIAESIAGGKKAEKDRLIKEEEEKERKRFEGTLVTIESFLKWKEVFVAEMNEKKRLQGTMKKVNTKPTGKDLFLQDSTFDNSDVAFLEAEGDSAVAVDESLFQDLDDLDLDLDLDENFES